MTGDTAFFFIADGDHLTAQAILLAASLRFHNGPAPQLLAYLPDATPTDLPSPVRAAFEALGVDALRLDTDPSIWKTPYPHGNKLFACAAPRQAERQVFLDSDMVCVAPLDTGVIGKDALAVVPEGTPTWGKGNDRWDRVYAHFGLPLPRDRVRLVRRRRIEFLPYFNAGMVGFHRDFGAAGRGFGQLWLDTAREIDRDVAVAQKRPWLDQVALPVALKRYGLGYDVLPDAWNFSISDRAFEPEAAPALIHYHSFRFAAEWPQVRAELARMAHTLGPALMETLVPLFGQHWFRAPQPAQ
ncbi:hypothetical protein [Oceaniglobus trochenteri]|uniref:hypothetical protein n=1 Tax=Oceaniglobus trochenteri TaxID=2763260 RepID=UPI001D000A0A|nr:hypothetical protein [Oceaniglobus trochenteri]